MMKQIQAAVLALLIASSISYSAMADELTPQQQAIEKRVYTYINSLNDEIRDGERDGSLKKPEVNHLINQLHSVQNRLENFKSAQNLDPQKELQLTRQLNRIDSDISYMQNNNLRWQRQHQVRMRNHR